MNAFISPPNKIPFYLRPGVWLAERIAGRELLPARLLAWYPRVAVSSGILEALIAHREPTLDERMLKLVRLQASFALACTFCIDMNWFERAKYGITDDEVDVLAGRREPDAVGTLTDREKIALEYTRSISRTPPAFPAEFVERLTTHFDAREIVILASTAAQVNYWSRLIQALGIPPVKYSDYCEVQARHPNI